MNTRGTHSVDEERRSAGRRQVALPGRITWKDSRGAIRFASIRTRDVSEDYAFVECLSGSPIPLYRLVQLQIDDHAQGVPAGLPPALARGRTLSAVFRVAPSLPATGLPEGYLLRLLSPPTSARSTAKATAGGLSRSIA